MSQLQRLLHPQKMIRISNTWAWPFPKFKSTIQLFIYSFIESLSPTRTYRSAHVISAHLTVSSLFHVHVQLNQCLSLPVPARCVGKMGPRVSPVLQLNQFAWHKRWSTSKQNQKCLQMLKMYMSMIACCSLLMMCEMRVKLLNMSIV